MGLFFKSTAPVLAGCNTISG